MNPSSMDPLNGVNAGNAADIINANRSMAQSGNPNAIGSGTKESRTQTLNRVKEQIASGTFTPDLQSLAKKLVQGGYLNE